MATTDTVRTSGLGGLSREEAHLTRNDSYDTDSTTASTHSASTFRTHDGANGPIASGKRRKGRSRQPPAPRGLMNLGNTCYANAALQCLFATALPHALLDHKKAAVFRRYASNGDILAMGSGSADSEDDEDWIGSGSSADDDENNRGRNAVGLSLGGNDRHDEERQWRREERRKRREKRLKEQERQANRELCQWLTGEMTDLTRNFTAAPMIVPEELTDDGGLFGSFFGSSSSSPPTNAVNPGSITRNVHKLCKTLRPYQQEDAHEFLRALLSGLVMEGQNRKLSALFDGLLESAVTCQTCRYSSLTRDRYMDLSLDISDKSVTDLPQALRHFTKTEFLDEDNMVECGRCKEKRVVSKGLRLATAPTVLVLQLKRFAFDMYGRMTRLNKDVKYPLHLEIGDYMSRANRATPPPYELVGVLVHAGRTCDSGHYFSYVKMGGKWYKANDSVVTEVSEDVALNQKPYILVYEVAGMKAKHGCDSYRRYHRRAEQERSGRARERDRSRARAQSAPRPHGLDRARSRATLERVHSDELDKATKGSQSRGHSRENEEPVNTVDCAFFSFFDIFEMCGATSDVADEEKESPEYQESTEPKSTSVRSSGKSQTHHRLRDEYDVSSGKTSRRSPDDKEVIGMPTSNSSPRLKATKQLDPTLLQSSASSTNSGPAHRPRLRRSVSSGSVRQLEADAARAYKKEIRKRASMALDIAGLDNSQRSQAPRSVGRLSASDNAESDCESDAESVDGVGGFAASDVVIGSKRGKHRRAKSLSRFVHKASDGAQRRGPSYNVSQRQRGRIRGGDQAPSGSTGAKGVRASHRRRASRSKSRTRGREGFLPPLPTGK